MGTIANSKELVSVAQSGGLFSGIEVVAAPLQRSSPSWTAMVATAPLRVAARFD